MAKVQQKSEKITPFGGIFHVRELFSRYVGPVIDKVLGLRCTSYGYQYRGLERFLVYSSFASSTFFEVKEVRGVKEVRDKCHADVFIVRRYRL